MECKDEIFQPEKMLHHLQNYVPGVFSCFPFLCVFRKSTQEAFHPLTTLFKTKCWNAQNKMKIEFMITFPVMNKI